jgi:hypothetical protein
MQLQIFSRFLFFFDIVGARENNRVEFKATESIFWHSGEGKFRAERNVERRLSTPRHEANTSAQRHSSIRFPSVPSRNCFVSVERQQKDFLLLFLLNLFQVE